jgi:hypothetical protein
VVILERQNAWRSIGELGSIWIVSEVDAATEPAHVWVEGVLVFDGDSEDNLLARVLQHDGYFWGVRVTVEKPAESNLGLRKRVLNH